MLRLESNKNSTETHYEGRLNFYPLCTSFKSQVIFIQVLKKDQEIISNVLTLGQIRARALNAQDQWFMQCVGRRFHAVSQLSIGLLSKFISESFARDTCFGCSFLRLSLKSCRQESSLCKVALIGFNDMP